MGWGHLSLRSPSTVLSQTTFIGEHPVLARQPDHPFTSTTKINNIPKINNYPQSVSQTLKCHCSTNCKAGPSASQHLSNTVWVKHRVPIHEEEEEEGCLHPASSIYPCLAVAPALSPGCVRDAWLQLNHFPASSSSPPPPGEGIGVPLFQALKPIQALEVPG